MTIPATAAFMPSPRPAPNAITADVAVITMCDLAQAVDFDREKMCNNIQSVRPGMPVLEVSARTGYGMERLLEFLRSRRAQSYLSNSA